MKKILLVKDDETLNKNITIALESEGYAVVNADSIKSAEMFVHSVNFIILDVVLPDGSGKKFCKHIRQDC